MGQTCETCQHPDRPTIDAELRSGQSTAEVYRLHPTTGRDSIYRHVRHGHHLIAPQASKVDAVAPNGSPQASTLAPAISITLRDVSGLVRAAKRHLNRSRAGDDLKATNGAITAVAKALELAGKLRGELQSGAQVNLGISLEASVAMDLRSAAQALDASDVTEQARSWLAAQIEAGDQEAERVVLGLMRMVRSADATVPGGTGVEQGPSGA